MNTLSLWEPLREGLTLRDAMNRLFEDSVVRPETLTRSLPMDVLETPDTFTVKASLPGCSKEQVELNFQKDTLTIKAHLNPPAPKPDNGEVVKNDRYLLRERFSGEVSRSLTLPMPVDVEKAVAKFVDGVLTLTLPKAEALKPRQIKVSE
ncbi:MAG TPA: Hsp20/alpha crystallin family protein [Candidatus Xenobia bacterium]|jgi:HSP20 family protein